MAGDRVLHRTPVLQQTPAQLVLLSGLALALGVAGDLASCGRIRLPAFGASLLTGCHYVAIILAAVGFGYRIGVAAAAAVGLVHVTVGMVACARSLPQQGEAATFVVVGLLAGLVTRYAPKSLESGFREPGMAALSQHNHGKKSPKADVLLDGQISPSLVQKFHAPLAAIESAGYALEEAALTSQNHREVAAIILKECHCLAGLTRSLEIVQPRSPSYREVQLSSLAGEISRLASPVTEAAAITLRRAEGPDLRLVCDPDLIVQAVLNLIANAIPIVGQGEEIVLSAHANKGDAMIKIFHPRVGLLGHVRVPMAVMPEGELRGRSRAVHGPSRRESGAE